MNMAVQGYAVEILPRKRHPTLLSFQRAETNARVGCRVLVALAEPHEGEA